MILCVCIDSDLQIAATIKNPGTPNANEKQLVSPKQCISRKYGVKVVDSNEPALIAR